MLFMFEQIKKVSLEEEVQELKLRVADLESKVLSKNDVIQAISESIKVGSLRGIIRSMVRAQNPSK